MQITTYLQNNKAKWKIRFNKIYVLKKLLNYLDNRYYIMLSTEKRF